LENNAPSQRLRNLGSYIAMTRAFAILALSGLAAAAPRPATDVPAIVTLPPRGSEPGAAPTRVTSNPTGPTSHGPYSGGATTTGQKQAPTTLLSKFDGPPTPNPTATYYNPDGQLRVPAQLPFVPGGVFIHCVASVELALTRRDRWRRRKWDFSAQIYGGKRLRFRIHQSRSSSRVH
jgi:hypothetical protein